MSAIDALISGGTSKAAPAATASRGAIDKLTSAPKQTPQAQPPAQGTRTLKLPAFLGGGVYQVDQNGKLVNGGHTNYGGVSSKPGFQRDDIIPASLGGKNSDSGNIRLIPNDIAHKQDDIETQTAKDVKSGTLQPKAAITQTLRQKDEIANPQPGIIKATIKEIPGVITRGFKGIKSFFGGGNKGDAMKFDVGAGMSPEQAQAANAQISREALVAQGEQQPSATNMDLPGAGIDLLRSIPRAAVSTGMSLIPGAANKSVQPTSAIERLFLGNDPVQSLARQQSDFEVAHPNLPKGVIPSVIGATAIAGKDVLDLLPGEQAADLLKGIGERGAAEAGVRTLATEGASGDILKPKMPEAVTPKAAEPKPKLELKTPEFAQELKSKLSPTYASGKATEAADVLRNAKAQVANQADIETTKFKDTAKYFDKLGDEASLKSLSDYERTGQFSNAPKGYSEFYKESTDQAHTILQTAYGDDKVGYVNNYVRRMFEFASAADEAKADAYFEKSLAGNKSVLKPRTTDLPTDELLADMKKNGIDAKLVTNNPEMLRQWTVKNAQKALTYGDAWDTLKQRGLIQLRQFGQPVPDGMVKLDDRAAQVFRPASQGGGTFYADPNVARILNNSISKGLIEASPTLKGIKTIDGTLKTFQLGLSAFHFTDTAINASISDLALGVRQLARGDVAGALRVGKGLFPGASFFSEMRKGGALIDGLKANSPEAFDFLDTKLNPAGGRIALDEGYRLKALDNMRQAFQQGSVNGFLKGVVQLPKGLVELVSKPLMEYAIPRVKVGAFMDMAADIQTRMPNASTDELNRAYAKAWDSIDNRFGELVYDNLFWHKSAQDLSMMSMRSVGWNVGTVREIGGGIVDAARFLKTLGKSGVTDRMLYSAALPLYTGMIGAVYMYLHTGKAPETLKDYFYPQNGLTTKDGSPDRASIPSYMKDVVAYGTNPLATIGHKASPLLDFTLSLIQNRDYYGDMVRNPDDPAGTQLAQVGGYVLQNSLPFSIQSGSQLKNEGAGKQQQVESFFGFNKAPATMTQSAQTKEYNQLYRQKNGLPGSRTPEQKQIDTEKAKARQRVKQGDMSAVDDLVQKGILKPKGVKQFVNNAKQTPDEKLLKLKGNNH